jgi:hypothetical protein
MGLACLAISGTYTTYRHGTNLHVTLRSVSVWKIELQWFIEGMVDLTSK